MSRLFSEWLQLDAEVEVITEDEGGDFIIPLPFATFFVEFKTSASAATVRHAVERLAKFARRGTVPILAVPFMGDVGRRICADVGVGWLDLSGNADIRTPRLRILVDGRPNRYVHLGRPSTPFAPKSSRLARWLLLHPKLSFTQRELAAGANLDRSQISRLVARLREERLVKIDEAGHVALNDRPLMLDAWNADYDFWRHDVVKGHMPGRTGDETMRALAREMEKHRISHAFTGLAAAWAFTRFAAFRLVTVYVEELPDLAWRRSIDFVEQDGGANVWFVRPEDLDVVQGARKSDGVMCVHPVQVWLDLKAQPERSADAADEIRERLLKGEFDG